MQHAVATGCRGLLAKPESAVLPRVKFFGAITKSKPTILEVPLAGTPSLGFLFGTPSGGSTCSNKVLVQIKKELVTVGISF